jgi:hypothetical protein
VISHRGKLKKNVRKLQRDMRFRQEAVRYRGPSTTRSAALPSDRVGTLSAPDLTAPAGKTADRRELSDEEELALEEAGRALAQMNCEEAQSILRDAEDYLANVIKEGAQWQEYCSTSSISRKNGPRIYSDEKVVITLNHQGQNYTSILTADEAEKRDLVKVIPRPIAGQYNMPLPPYMGLSEAAEYLGTTPQYLSGKISKRNDFPRPIAVLRCGPIWKTEEIIEYWREKN